MQEESTLLIIDKMVKENNQGVILLTTIADVKFVPHGAIIGFGAPEEIGKYANTQTVIGVSDYMFMCFAVKKSELEKYRAAQTET